MHVHTYLTIDTHFRPIYNYHYRSNITFVFKRQLILYYKFLQQLFSYSNNSVFRLFTWSNQKRMLGIGYLESDAVIEYRRVVDFCVPPNSSSIDSKGEHSSETLRLRLDAAPTAASGGESRSEDFFIFSIHDGYKAGSSDSSSSW